MARVTVFAVRAGTFENGLVRGKPNGVSKISTVNTAFNAAGSPDYRIPQRTEALIIITDTAIDFVVVRTDNAATTETPIPVPLSAGGLSQYVMTLEDDDNDLFVRTMA